MSKLIETCHLTKRYGDKLVLRDVGLSLGAGHCLALLGHNGAGKTTLMKLLLGLTAPSDGEVRLLGQDPRTASGAEARRAVGYLPENVAFEGAMTGRELLRFYAGLKAVSHARCDQLLEEVGLAGAARLKVRTYSKGMRQRLGLAQALLGAPRLLFLDEPTNGLDPPLRRHFYQAIAALTAEGTSAVVSSHVLSEIEARADVVAILRAGTLVAFGALDDLRQASGLPLRLRLTVTPESVGEIAEAVGGGFALQKVEGGTMDFTCGTADKMAVVRRLAKLNGVVRDLDIQPPRLEDIYAHFAAEEGMP
ncbi:MAG: ABC transporter ATP-binding protein [Pseudomonadota bacterium]